MDHRAFDRGENATPLDLLAWTVVGAVAFAAAWAVVAVPMEAIHRAMAPVDRTPLAFFAVFGAPDLKMVAGQLARGALLALALAPFRGWIAILPRPTLVLFGAYTGLAMLGSVEPLPGSLEGWFYTETTPTGHAVTVAAAVVHGGLVAAVMRRALPHRATTGNRSRADGAGRGRYGRFVALHTVTYLAMGVLFFTVQDYAGAFATDPRFAWFRPLDDPWVAAAIPAQIPRGLLLATCLMPFVPVVVARRRGWLLLFWLLFATTALGAASIVPGLLGATPNALEPASLLTGLPEVATQMLLFSVLFVAGERRRRKVRRATASQHRAQQVPSR